MALNYDLTNTGPEVQERLDQVMPNTDSIAAEAAARQQADGELQAAIESEQSAREAADQTQAQATRAISLSLTAEVEARQQADGELQAAIESEESAREAADQAQTQAIAAEAEARQQADEELDSNLRQYTDQKVAGAFDGSIGRVWDVIGDIIGQDVSGIQMTVEPVAFQGVEAEVVIQASSEGAPGIFETLAFYANDVLIQEFEQVESARLTLTISQRTVLRCVARIAGQTYTKQQVINRLTAFYIGGGQTAGDVINDGCIRDIQDGMAGEYQVELAEGNRLIIAMDVTYQSEFSRADMNGFEIPFSSSIETIDGTEYFVLVSTYAYREGLYSIYINR